MVSDDAGIQNFGARVMVVHNVLANSLSSAAFWQRRRIPPPSVLDGRAGGRSPSEVRSTSSSYRRGAKSAGAVGLPSPRNPAEILKAKQRALVVSWKRDRESHAH